MTKPTATTTKSRRTPVTNPRPANTNRRKTASPRSQSRNAPEFRTVAPNIKQVSHACSAILTSKTTKLASIIDLLRRGQGATLPELMAATSWQTHSVRGALAGAVRKRGFTVESTKTNGVRSYRIVREEPHSQPERTR